MLSHAATAYEQANAAEFEKAGPRSLGSRNELARSQSAFLRDCAYLFPHTQSQRSATPTVRLGRDRRNQRSRRLGPRVSRLLDSAACDAYSRISGRLRLVVIRIQRVLTDNGGAYRSRPFRKTCRWLGISTKRTRPYRPQTNGKAERVIQTLLRKWAYARPYLTSAHRRRALDT